MDHSLSISFEMTPQCVVPQSEGDEAVVEGEECGGSAEECQSADADGCESECDDPEDGADPGDEESEASVAYLTGHKLERMTDLVVAVPGHDFVLSREYTSDASYYRNPGTGASRRGEFGANWTGMGLQRLQGSDLGGDAERLTLVGMPVRSNVRFYKDDTVTPAVWAPGGKSQSRIEQGSVTVGADTYNVWKLWSPGGKTFEFFRGGADLPDADGNASNSDDMLL
ncbi:MAG: hypothetical protein AAGB34_11295, partial [Planctomycetota bacterium]